MVQCPKMSRIWFTNSLKQDHHFHPCSVGILFHCQPSYTLQEALAWRLTVNLNKTVLRFFAAQPAQVREAPKKFLTYQWHRVGGLKWQCIVHCHLLQFHNNCEGNSDIQDGINHQANKAAALQGSYCIKGPPILGAKKSYESLSQRDLRVFYSAMLKLVPFYRSKCRKR